MQFDKRFLKTTFIKFNFTDFVKKNITLCFIDLYSSKEDLKKNSSLTYNHFDNVSPISATALKGFDKTRTTVFAGKLVIPHPTDFV